ncbi:thermonuclease family protein [Bradyrhizobium viridifuturi]|uniref:thermonuclease family protein n=1 Tax=uncultured Bradyrhizobium sp. TaxID=199684 RepID=UPI001BA4A3E5|nr:thermonuclease family protein [uncultured Bradyrhizobium sp.]MBR1040698.1 thermonuclease family protein [Bradyrhizobium viridifuturi]MBR1074986.1 thermonuclease family protein [Bradyrhizobium viridifuturi]
MGRVLRLFTVLAFCGMPLSAANAQTSPSAWFTVPANAIYLTGDSWSVDGTTYRLYGVQACLRGTSFTNGHGINRDCGEASLAMLVALTRDLRPQCYDAAEAPQTRTIFVFCVATPTTGAGAGSRIDLGTALIATGFAFASLKPDGQPVHPPYWVAQQVAARSKAGLWAFADLPDPNAIILRALQRPSAAEPSSPAPVPPPSPNTPQQP